MNSKQGAVIGIIAILVIIAGVYASGLLTTNNDVNGNITVLAGAGTMHAMNELKTNFEKEHPGTKVNIQYGNSGELFAVLGAQKVQMLWSLEI